MAGPIGLVKYPMGKMRGILEWRTVFANDERVAKYSADLWMPIQKSHLLFQFVGFPNIVRMVHCNILPLSHF